MHTFSVNTCNIHTSIAMLKVNKNWITGKTRCLLYYWNAIICFADKPLLVVDYLENQEVIENTSLEVCCQGHSNPSISYIYWTGNVTLVVFNDTESCLTFKLINRNNTGRYTCFASNSIGLSNKSIELNVLCKYYNNRALCGFIRILFFGDLTTFITLRYHKHMN